MGGEGSFEGCGVDMRFCLYTDMEKGSFQRRRGIIVRVEVELKIRPNTRTERSPMYKGFDIHARLEC